MILVSQSSSANATVMQLENHEKSTFVKQVKQTVADEPNFYYVDFPLALLLVETNYVCAD